jgi:serine/threonine-protein kinase mTOR
MTVMRENRESLMAVLEAFVYEPLLAWRLNATNRPGGRVNDTVDPDDPYAKQGKKKANETEILNGGYNVSCWLIDAEKTEVKNDKALQVIDKVRRKLTGRDYRPDQSIDVKLQVERLVEDATKTENLCVAFLGWQVACFVSLHSGVPSGEDTRHVVCRHEEVWWDAPHLA